MTSLQDIQKKFTDEVQYVDDLAQIVLKGHLVMEDLMTEAIQTFLLHGEFIESVRLQFHQKLALCRAISTSDQNNNMWNLIGSVNSLRNALSHSLDPHRRSNAIQALRTIYEHEFKNVPNSTRGIPKDIEKEMPKDSALCLYAISGSLGYLHSFLEEVRRLKAVIVEIDAAMNKGALSKV